MKQMPTKRAVIRGGAAFLIPPPYTAPTIPVFHGDLVADDTEALIAIEAGRPFGIADGAEITVVRDGNGRVVGARDFSARISGDYEPSPPFFTDCLLVGA